MPTAFKKLKKQNGESLLEALVAILIIAITSSILLMYIQSSAEINSKARDAFAAYGEEMEAAESQIYEGDTIVTINGFDRTVHYSGNTDANELHSYWR